jgi:hypothetical protein
MFPPASIPKLATTTERPEAAVTLPPARIARVETLFVKVRLLVTSRFPPVSNRSVLAVIVPSSAAVRDNVPATSVPAVIALEDVNGSNLTAPVPALMEPVKLTLFDLTVTAVFVAEIGAPTVSAATVDVDASKTSETDPVELKEPGWTTASSFPTVPDLVAEKVKPPKPAATEDGAVAESNIAAGRRGPEPVTVIRLPMNSKFPHAPTPSKLELVPVKARVPVALNSVLTFVAETPP